MLQRVVVLALSCAVAATPARPQGGSWPAPKTILIQAGRVLDVRAGRYLNNQALLVEKDRIKEIGPLAEIEARAPKGAAVMDLRKATVLPGLIDCHAHLLMNSAATMGPGPNILLAVAGMSPARRALAGAANAREDLEAGFTTVRNVGHSGVDGDAALRDAINAGWVPGPRILAATRKITPPGGQAVRLEPALSKSIVEQEFLPVSGTEEARRAVREALYAGADLVKVVVDAGPRSLTVDEMKAIVDEAHRAKIKVAAHATGKAAIQAAVDAGVDSVEHADEASDEALKAMRDKGIFLGTTEWTRETFLDLVNQSVVLSPAEREAFEAWLKGWVAQTTSRLERARKIGVKIVAGSDMWFQYPGKTRGEATKLMFRALRSEGVPPLEILRATTLNAAELLGWQDRVGSLEPNKFADLIAVEGDPLNDITELERVKFVMKGGAVVRGWEVK